MTTNPFQAPTSIQAQVDEIMARSRSRFGHGKFFMTQGTPEGGAGEGGAGEGGSGEGGAGTGSGEGGAGQGAGESGAGAGSGAAKGEKIEDLPEWAQKVIKDARADAGKARTDAKKTAAEEASAATLTKVLEALGVKGNKTPTLEEVQAELDKVKNENGSKEGALKQRTIELAVYRTASKKGIDGDADALLDSRSFLEKVSALDPDHKEFGAKVEQAIKDAVKDNPKLKASQAGAGTSSADHGSGGSGEGGQRQPKSLTDAVSGHYGT